MMIYDSTSCAHDLRCRCACYDHDAPDDDDALIAISMRRIVDISPTYADFHTLLYVLAV